MKWVKNKQKLNKKDWHLWFAWKPVVLKRLPDGNEEYAWLTTILRRFVYDTSGVMKIGISGFWRAEYKERPNVPDIPTKAPLPRVIAVKKPWHGEMIKIPTMTKGELSDLENKPANPLDQIDQAEETWSEDEHKEYDKEEEKLSKERLHSDLCTCPHCYRLPARKTKPIVDYLGNPYKDVYEETPYDDTPPEDEGHFAKKYNLEGKGHKVVIPEEKEPTYRDKPQIKEVMVRNVEKPEKVVGKNVKHDIDASWEAKRVKRTNSIF